MTLRLRICKAMLQKDMDTWSKMDPYMKIQLGDQKLQTKTHNGGGKNPVWNEQFELNVTEKYQQDELILSVLDDDPISDDKIGQFRTPVSNFLAYSNVNSHQEFPLKSKDEVTGKIMLDYRYESNIVPQNQNTFLMK